MAADADFAAMLMLSARPKMPWMALSANTAACFDKQDKRKTEGRLLSHATRDIKRTTCIFHEKTVKHYVVRPVLMFK